MVKNVLKFLISLQFLHFHPFSHVHKAKCFETLINFRMNQINNRSKHLITWYVIVCGSERKSIQLNFYGPSVPKMFSLIQHFEGDEISFTTLIYLTMLLWMILYSTNSKSFSPASFILWTNTLSSSAPHFNILLLLLA